jgi:3-oxoacyl-[acyl-carrier-protein] synthase I
LNSIYTSSINCITPLGFSLDSNWKALKENKSGVKLYEQFGNLSNLFFSRIEDDKLDAEFAKLNLNLTSFSRLEKMMVLALEPIVKKNNISNRTGFIFSTTKGNIDALQSKTTFNQSYLSIPAKKIANYYGFINEPIVVSNACVSGIYAVALAKRMIQARTYDNVYVVAADIISEFVLSGFNSFQALSDEPCKPYDAKRKGVNLGEAAAAILITSQKNEESQFEIIGDGAINDANHISGPSRTGEGLVRSIQSAIDEAQISNEAIDFISAHGTATIYNDEMEAIAFNRLNLQNKPVNSLKGYFGHTLGASGLLETVISLKSAMENELIASKNFNEMGVSQPIAIVEKNCQKSINCFIKTASGFGGSNTAVIFKKI